MEPVTMDVDPHAAPGAAAEPLRLRGAVLRYLAYPALMGAVLACAVTAWRPGREPVLITVLFLCVFGAAVLLERLFPFVPAWNRGWKDSSVDGALFLLAQPAVALAELVTGGIGIALALALARAIGPAMSWQMLPLAAQVIVALLLSELPLYLLHRISHRSSGLLWRLHAIHHAPDRVYTLNFARFHPLNVFGNACATLLPLVLLGTPPQVIFLVAALQKTHGVLTHTNFDFRLGPLNWILSMAELHRWHHVRDLRHADGNFGGMLIVWDVVFGTRRRPSLDVTQQALGLVDPETVPAGLGAQLIQPLTRSRNA